jgi:hypothetical protein
MNYFKQYPRKSATNAEVVGAIVEITKSNSLFQEHHSSVSFLKCSLLFVLPSVLLNPKGHYGFINPSYWTLS